jgi:hydroxypyruvate isomerase
MPTLAANLSLLFADAPLLARFARARAAGFHHVELQFPYAEPPAAMADALAASGLSLVLFNLPAGDWASGERGLPADPARVAEFRAGVGRAIELAERLGVTRLNCLAGNRGHGLSAEEQRLTLLENLHFAAGRLAQHGLTLLVEPLNRHDHPDYLLSSSRAALDVIDAVGAANLKLQYDVYHMQRGEGELAATIAAHLGQIGHIQIADTPGRHEPGSGEINYRFLLPYLDQIGYAGYVGAEYLPAGRTEDGLGWVAEHGLRL